MLFTSLEFLFLFLPATLAVYYALPFRWNLKNLWLLAASLGFYAWGEPRFVFAMLASIAFNYGAALLVEALRVRGRGGAMKGALAGAVAGNLALIGVWKYGNFVTETLRSWFPSWQGVVPQTSFLMSLVVGRISPCYRRAMLELYRIRREADYRSSSVDKDDLDDVLDDVRKLKGEIGALVA